MTPTPSDFRQVLARLDMTDPSRAVREGWYVPPPDDVSGQVLARHFNLDPTARIMVLGGIGVGKSTALLATRDALARDTITAYVDVPLYQSVERLRPGFLLRFAALLALRHRKASGPLSAVERVDAEVLHAGLSNGDGVDLIDRAFLNAGALPTPERREFEAIIERFGESSPGWRTRQRVLLVDGLDLIDEGAALDALIDDLRTLRHRGFGVCVAGSIGWRYSLSPELASSFDKVLPWPVPNPEVDPAHRAFLREVLARRVGPSAFAPEALDRAAVSSGGVMRDLIVIARRAVFEKLLDAGSAVLKEHVERAVAEVGHERQLALDGFALGAARRVLDDPEALVHGSQLADLLRRAVLLPDDARQQRFRVHPALIPFLRGREAA